MRHRTLTELLQNIKEQTRAETITIGALIETFHERGFGFFLFLFALPAALPVPAVGYGTVLAAPLLLLTAQQAYGRRSVWLPKSMRGASVPRDKLHGVIDAAIPLIEKIEFLISPRLLFVTQGRMSQVIGLAGLIMALAVCVPLPFTNTVPSFGIALMAVGLMMRDGIAVLAGALVGTLWVAMLVFLGQAGVRILTSVIM